MSREAIFFVGTRQPEIVSVQFRHHFLLGERREAVDIETP